MTRADAAALIAILVNAFPYAKFTAENAQVYEQHIMDLEAQETQRAIGELIATNKHLPAVAEIRSEVVRQRRAMAAEEHERRPRLPAPGGMGPSPYDWSRVLGEMLKQSARHRRIAERWYRSKGKTLPPDPMAPYIAIAQAGASGEDVREAIKRELKLPRSDA